MLKVKSTGFEDVNIEQSIMPDIIWRLKKNSLSLVKPVFFPKIKSIPHSVQIGYLKSGIEEILGKERAGNFTFNL